MKILMLILFAMSLSLISCTDAEIAKIGGYGG